MHVWEAAATFEDLSMNDNSALSSGPDIENVGSTISCSTSCIAGQYSEGCDIAMSNDVNVQYPINCKVG